MVGPGIARVWTSPRGSYRDSHQKTKLSVLGGDSVTITAPVGSEPALPAGWKLAEVQVPAGTQTLRLETLPSTNASGNIGYFDGFTFAPNGTLLSMPDKLEAQVGVPFSYQPAINVAATFSATGLPAELSIDPATGLIAGTPAAATTVQFSITATGPADSDTKSVSLYIGQPLGIALEQPTWNWRSSPSAENAWRAIAAVSTPFGPFNTVDGVDAVEMQNVIPEDSWIGADVAGPGWISWNQVAFGGTYGGKISIAVIVDGVAVGPHSVPPGSSWGDRKLWIPAGTHVVRWTARLSPVGPGRAGPARMDQFSFTPAANPADPSPGTQSYAAWAAALPNGQDGPNDDGDGDGVPNWSEYTYGNATGPSWPPAPATSLEGNYFVFTSVCSGAASEGLWSFEMLHSAIPNYPGGWSEATTRERAFIKSGATVTAKIDRTARVTPSTLGVTVVEPAARHILGRFKVRKP